MASGGYRPGAGRPKGKKDQKPRKRKERKAPLNGNKEKIRELLKAGAIAKAKLYQEFLQRVAAGEQLTLPEKKLMAKLEADLSADVGEKEKAPEVPQVTDLDSPEFLRKVWNDPKVDMALRIRAAEVVIKGETEKKGKKEEKADRAKAAGSGRFAPARPPHLKIVENEK